MIVRFSNYLRHNMDFMNYSELIPFSKEEEHIDNFIYIQQMRFLDKLHFSKEISVRDFQLPPLTVQPIIENAVKYGVRGSLKGGSVLLKIDRLSDGIHIIVSNSGPGFDTEKLAGGHSIENICTRLKNLLNASLTIKSKEGQPGTIVEIIIPE